jgi:hypothetical protein
VPQGWPDYSSWWDEELLAPFLRCTSPAEFLALQRRVDMPRLLEALEDWSAVRLGALGPLETQAAQVLQRKRFSFLVTASRRYGAYAQVLTLFLMDTSFDDELRELLRWLARDKQLQQTLGQMEAVRQALARRGMPLSDYPDRREQPRDVLRGLGRAADDVASTLPLRDGLQGAGVFATRAHLPPPYQQAFDETQQALLEEHFAPGHLALGTFDSLTFGVPLGFYHLVAGTGHGVSTLAQGQYEQATRELAPAALLVGLYAGGKGWRSLSEARKAAGAMHSAGRLPELRLQMLKEAVERLRLRLGEDGLGQLARYLQAEREAALLVAAGGEPAALALFTARGDRVKAQAWLSQAKPEPGGSSPGNVASRADEAAGPPGKHSTIKAPADTHGSPERLAQAGEFASSIRWKGFADGKLASHFRKHVLEAGEFGGKMTQNEYLKMAKEFAQEKNKRFLEKVVGNFVVKHDPTTRRTLIGHIKDREIRTFYEADSRAPDPFVAAVELARNLGEKQ